MSTAAVFLHPSILTFLGVASIPALLMSKRSALATVNRGFFLVVVGVSIISLATLVDYLIQVAISLDMKTLMSTWLWQEQSFILAVFFYFPGTIMAAVGLASWLPAVQRLDREIQRREQTERELIELSKELERLAVKAEEASHAKSEFLASMSHELRTPLNAIIGFSEMIATEMFGSVDKPQYVEYGALIQRSGIHLLDIVGDILDIAKIEAGEMELKETVVDIYETVSDCLPILAPQLEEVGIYTEIRRKSVVGHLLADRRVVKQMIINLLSNGIKFSPAGGKIEIYLGEFEGAVELTVVDHGIGMRPDQVDFVLKPFSQIEQVSTRSHEGTGLGLTIVKQMIELHGGSIAIDTEPDTGTAVTLRFPPDRTVTIS